MVKCAFFIHFSKIEEGEEQGDMKGSRGDRVRSLAMGQGYGDMDARIGIHVYGWGGGIHGDMATGIWYRNV